MAFKSPKPSISTSRPPLWRVLFTLERDRSTKIKWIPILVVTVFAFSFSLLLLLPPFFNYLSTHSHTYSNSAYRMYLRNRTFPETLAAVKYADSRPVRDTSSLSVTSLGIPWCSQYLKDSQNWLDQASPLYSSVRRIRIACLGETGQNQSALIEAETYAGEVASRLTSSPKIFLPLATPSRGLGYLASIQTTADDGLYPLAALLADRAGALQVTFSHPIGSYDRSVNTSLALYASPSRCLRAGHDRSVWRLLRFACTRAGRWPTNARISKAPI